jgi:hypothetical protein
MTKSMIVAEITVEWPLLFCFVQLVPKPIFNVDFETSLENIITSL